MKRVLVQESADGGQAAWRQEGLSKKGLHLRVKGEEGRRKGEFAVNQVSLI